MPSFSHVYPVNALMPSKVCQKLTCPDLCRNDYPPSAAFDASDDVFKLSILCQHQGSTLISKPFWLEHGPGTGWKY